MQNKALIGALKLISRLNKYSDNSIESDYCVIRDGYIVKNYCLGGRISLDIGDYYLRCAPRVKDLLAALNQAPNKSTISVDADRENVLVSSPTGTYTVKCLPYLEDAPRLMGIPEYSYEILFDPVIFAGLVKFFHHKESREQLLGVWLSGSEMLASDGEIGIRYQHDSGVLQEDVLLPPFICHALVATKVRSVKLGKLAGGDWYVKTDAFSAVFGMKHTRSSMSELIRNVLRPDDTQFTSADAQFRSLANALTSGLRKEIIEFFDTKIEVLAKSDDSVLATYRACGVEGFKARVKNIYPALPFCEQVYVDGGKLYFKFGPVSGVVMGLRR